VHPQGVSVVDKKTSGGLWVLKSDRPESRGDVGCETAKRERRIEQLIDRLPQSWRPFAWWLRRPSRRVLRISIGVLLIVGGLLSILPVFGLWMLPVGLLLLAEDVPVLCRATDRVLEWVERRRPHWLQRNPKRIGTVPYTIIHDAYNSGRKYFSSMPTNLATRD
jgi:hypothetical protein